ncbi:MAG: hypothetical protein AAF560_30405, partial [Acidobacteriota bacterium]
MASLRLKSLAFLITGCLLTLSATPSTAAAPRDQGTRDGGDRVGPGTVIIPDGCDSRRGCDGGGDPGGGDPGGGDPGGGDDGGDHGDPGPGGDEPGDG